MRKNINGVMLKVLLALVGILIVAVFSAGVFYALTGYRLDAAEKKAVKFEEDVVKVGGEVKKNATEFEKEMDKIDARVDLVEDVVSIIQNDLNYIRGDLIEQKELSKEILRELKK